MQAPQLLRHTLQQIHCLRQLFRSLRRIGDRLGPALGALVDEGLASELRGTDGVWALGLGDGVAPAAVRDHMLAAGVIPRPIPAATVAFCPPLVIGDDDLDLIVDATRKALADLAEAQA